MRNFVITVNGTQYEVAVEEVAAGAAPVAAAPVAAAPTAPKAAPAAKKAAPVAAVAGEDAAVPARSLSAGVIAPRQKAGGHLPKQHAHVAGLHALEFKPGFRQPLHLPTPNAMVLL